MPFDLQSDMDKRFLQSGFEEGVELAIDGQTFTACKAIVERNGAYSGGRVPAGQVAGQTRSTNIRICLSTTDAPAIHKNQSKIKIKKNAMDVFFTTFTITGIADSDAGSITVEVSP
jgi:hypothetical protein